MKNVNFAKQLNIKEIQIIGAEWKGRTIGGNTSILGQKGESKRNFSRNAFVFANFSWLVTSQMA